MPTPESFRFQVNLGGMLDILSNHLYKSPDVFLRELLQNGIDAITLRKKKQPTWSGGRIVITLDPGQSMVFQDNGAGLTKEEIHQFLAVIGQSSKTILNPDGSIPNPKNSFNTSYPSSRFLESGSYFRLKNLQIGYSLPEKMISRAGFKSCRVYLQGSNLFTATKYSGFDPEVNGGVDNGNYPQSRSFLIGVNISY